MCGFAIENSLNSVALCSESTGRANLDASVSILESLGKLSVSLSFLNVISLCFAEKDMETQRW